jgi:hypothetical protein
MSPVFARSHIIPADWPSEFRDYNSDSSLDNILILQRIAFFPTHRNQERQHSLIRYCLPAEYIAGFGAGQATLNSVTTKLEFSF